MNAEDSTEPKFPEWATKGGDIWAQRWKDTDAALEGLSPHLTSAILASRPTGSFRAFEIGCGPGSTTIAIADACPEAEIVACDISPSLAAIARERTSGMRNACVLVGDAEELAASEGPFDLIFSRHGVMFFEDAVRAFQTIRNASKPGAALVFSCFQSWDSNPWASELASAAADRLVPSPGREPSGFAFADPDYVIEIFRSSGWSQAQPEPIVFRYVAAEGDDAVQKALSFLSDIGPASRIVQALPEDAREDAVERMRGTIERHVDGTAVVFRATAWIWKAKAI